MLMQQQATGNLGSDSLVFKTYTLLRQKNSWPPILWLRWLEFTINRTIFGRQNPAGRLNCAIIHQHSRYSGHFSYSRPVWEIQTYLCSLLLFRLGIVLWERSCVVLLLSVRVLVSDFDMKTNYNISGILWSKNYHFWTLTINLSSE